MPDLKVTDDSPQRVGYFDELNSPDTSAYTLPRVAGSSGQVITIDANGDCNFQSVGDIGTLGSIEFRATPYFDDVNAAADNWSPSGKTITPEVIFNLSVISYSATKANNTWRYDETTGLTFSGGTEDTGVSRPALGFATHSAGNTNPNVTGNFIFTDSGGTDHTFSFRIDWILIQEGAAGSDGAAGTAARGVTLTASDQSIEYNKDGTTPNPSSVTVFAEAVNASETDDVYFEFFIDDVSQGAPAAAGNDSPFAAQITIASPTTIGSPKKVECQIREGGASNPILARDQIVIFPLKQGSDAITIILSNEAHTLPTTNSGTVTYTDSGTDIEVYEGTNQLGYDGTSPYPNSTYRVSAVGTNVTVSTPTTVTDTSPLDLYSPQTGYVRRYGDHSNMTADNASITYTITVKNDEGKETVFTKKQSLAKSIQGGEGADGSDGRTVTLSAGDQLFDYDTNGANPTGKNSTDNTTVITAEARNTTGTLYYEFFVDDTSVQGPNTSDTYTYTAQADIADMPDKIEVEVREGSNSPPSIVARDQFTIFGLQPGSSAITIAMSNEAHSIRTGPLGDSPSASYSDSGTTFDVFEGNVQLDYDDTVPYGVGTYRISADISPTSDITIGTASTAANGKTRIIGDHSNMVNADEQIVYEVTVKRADGTETTFTRTQTLNKSEKGETGEDGSDAKTVRLTAADYVIEYDQSGKNPNVSGDSPSEEIILTATAQNFVDPYFKFTGDGITDETVYTDGTGDSDTFSFSVPTDYSSTPKTLRVGVAEASADTVEIAFDSITIASVKEGSGNIAAFLSNDSHVFPASSSGAVTDYSGSGTRIEVYEGAVELDYDGSGTTAGHFTVSTSGTNITPGAISEYDSPPVNSPAGYKALVADASTGVADGIDTSSIEFTITGKRGDGSDFTLQKTQTFSKSKSGADGTNGTDGIDGDDGKQNASGLVYYTVAQASNPGAPSATSYNFSSRAFTGLTSNWQTTPVEVEISDTTTKYWTSRYDVTETTAGGGTGTPSFDTPTGSINFGANIQSDNYIAGTFGWQIQRDTGDAEFNNVNARGALLGGKTGPRDYINYNSPLDSPLPFTEVDSPPTTLHTGFYLGPDGNDSPYTGSYDFIIGDSTNQLRFDGSSGELDIRGAKFTVGSGDNKVTINSNQVQLGDNFLLDYDSSGSKHRLLMSTASLIPGTSIPSAANYTEITNAGINHFTYFGPTTQFKTEISGSSITLLDINNSRIILNDESLRYYEGTAPSDTLRWTIGDSTVGTTNAKITGGLQITGAIIDSGGNDGTSGYVPTADGSGGWAWAAQTGAGGSVTGSGTTNKVAKWSGSSTLTDSLITDDGSTVTVGGNLTVTGTTTTVNTTNTTVTDNLLELNSGVASNANDTGIIIERGSTGDNALFIWDESADKFALGTTTGTASSTGNITYTDAGLQLSTINISDDLVFGNRVTTDGHIQLYSGSSSTGYGIGVEANTLYQRSDDYFRWYIDSFADGGTSDYMELSTTALTVNAGLNVSGDAAFDTDTLFVDVSADRVGINESTPAYSLDVNGTGRFTTSLRVGATDIRSWSSSDTDIDGLISGTTAGDIIECDANAHLVVGIRGNDAGDSFSIISGGGNYLTDSTYDTLVAHFGADGKVGIGMESAGQVLEVAGAIKGAASANSGDAFYIGNDSKLVDINVANVGAIYGQSDTTIGGLKFGSGGGTIYGASSNIGITQSNPQTNLDVGGSGTSDICLQLRSGDSAGGTDASQIVFAYAGGSYNSSGYAHSIRTRHNAGLEDGNAIDFWLWDQGTDTASTLGSKRVMTIEGTGRVGIGTDDPSDTLHVVGIAKVTSAVLTSLLKSGNGAGLVTLQGGNSGGANIELYGESHSSFANDAYYDADVHNFRSASAATNYATFAAAEIDFTRNLNMNNYNITGVNSLAINDPGPNEGISWSGGSGWSIYESPDDLTTNSAGNLQFVDSGSRIFTLNTSGNAEFTGNVGIGTTPSYSLDVVGNCEIDNQTNLGSTQYDEQEILRVAGRNSNVSTIIFSQFRDAAGSDWTTAGSRIQQKIDSTYMAYMQFNGSGKNAGISWGTGSGTAGPESATERMVLNSSGNLTVTGDVTAFVSDERLKTRIDTIDNAVEKVCSLNGFIYKFNDTAKDLGFDTEKRQVGLSAQEVEKVLPEVIKPAPVDNEYKTLDYAKVVPLLVEAIKEQQEQIENLQKKLEEMSK